MPRFKRYLLPTSGTPLIDVVQDVPPLQKQAKERTGYPTQKPLALLERIIKASSNEGDMVLVIPSAVAPPHWLLRTD